MLVWIAFQSGRLSVSLQDPILWHAHEMIFGFASAIVAGFLLTASQNWTGIRGVHGLKLKILVTVWILGRLTSITSAAYPLLYTLLDLSFYPLLALLLKPYLWQPSQKRNQIFFVLFAVLFFTNLSIHLETFQIPTPVPARSLLMLGLFAVLMMIGLIGGRVIPFFTQNAIPTANPQHHSWIEFLSLPAIALAGISVVFWEFSIITTALCFVAGLVHLIRWALWNPWRSIRNPILLILYIGYAWMFVGFFLRGLASLSIITPSPSIHALTAGSIGIMIYGMITRVSLGHTGRPIRASNLIIAGYLLLIAASVIRVAGPIVLPKTYQTSIQWSGILWAIAFGLFLVEYTPILCTPRPDGKEG